jgi:hypothetical protein
VSIVVKDVKMHGESEVVYQTSTLTIAVVVRSRVTQCEEGKVRRVCLALLLNV